MDRKQTELILKESMVHIGNKIKKEREDRGWDQLEVVIRSGVSQSVIYNLEIGVADNITMKSLIGLSAAFEIDIISLIRCTSQ